MFPGGLGALNETAMPGETASPVQLDYYRQKIVEFQNVLYQLDESARSAQGLLDLQIDDSELNDNLNGWLANYDLKKGLFRTAAEGLNFAISGVNLIGANFPSVSVPRGLNAIPLVAAAGIAGALVVAAGLVVWGRDAIKILGQYVSRSQALNAIPEGAQRAAVAAELARLDAAAREADASPLGSIANIVKYVAIAAVIYFGLQTFQKMKA
ncbi:MAG: hypothetical protein EBU96_09420 [Actinobacteria bacterium]|nr:hypothetical protein [Actinomycetota bacterium]